MTTKKILLMVVVGWLTLISVPPTWAHKKQWSLSAGIAIPVFHSHQQDSDLETKRKKGPIRNIAKKTLSTMGKVLDIFFSAPNKQDQSQMEHFENLLYREAPYMSFISMHIPVK